MSEQETFNSGANAETANNEGSDRHEVPTPKKSNEPILKPLRYHEDVCNCLTIHEKEVWQWFSDFNVLEKSFSDSRDSLLKNTYRLSTDSHASVYELCNLAMQRLGIEAPVTLYQANDGAMNAALFYIPKEIHIVLYGPLLDKLSEGELLALLGHELSHYLLWSLQEGRYFIAQQVLEDSVAKAPHNNSLYETARVYALNTETFADRGGVLAAQDDKQSIAVLVKVMTGLSKVDATAFLQQAKELEAKGDVSNASSHPELYLRALLMNKWHAGEANIDDWIDAKLKGPINIHCLDVLNQLILTELTDEFFHYILDNSQFATDAVVNQVQAFFPSWTLKTESIDFISKIKALDIDDSTKDYFIALVFDIAQADKDQSDEVLSYASEVMTELAWLERYRDSLKTILKLPKTKIDKLIGKVTQESKA